MSAGKTEAAAARGRSGVGPARRRPVRREGCQGVGRGGEARSAVSGGQWIVVGGDAVAYEWEVAGQGAAICWQGCAAVSARVSHAGRGGAGGGGLLRVLRCCAGEGWLMGAAGGERFSAQLAGAGGSSTKSCPDNMLKSKKTPGVSQGKRHHSASVSFQGLCSGL